MLLSGIRLHCSCLVTLYTYSVHVGEIWGGKGEGDTFLRAREEVAPNQQIYIRDVGRLAVKTRTEQLKTRVQFIDIFPSLPGFPYIFAVCVFRNTRERKRRIRGEKRRGEAQYSPRKFRFVCASICEFAMVMRIGGRSATGWHPRGRLQFFPLPPSLPRLDCDRPAVGSERERSELFGETSRKASRNWSMPIGLSGSCFIRCAPIHLPTRR